MLSNISKKKAPEVAFPDSASCHGPWHYAFGSDAVAMVACSRSSSSLRRT
jgi:hypothetical protein